jgi:hypothetical protein
MDCCKSQKGTEAGREPLPADGKSAVCLLEPGKRPLGLKARGLHFDRSTPWPFGVADLFRYLRADATRPELLGAGLWRRRLYPPRGPSDGCGVCHVCRF